MGTCPIRRNTQAAYAPLQDHVGLSLPSLHPTPEIDQKLRDEGIRNPNDDPQRTHPLYTANGLGIAWEDYQGQLIRRINELTAETPFYGQLPRPIVLATARDPLRAALFNHASMALNNTLFFNGISKDGPTEIPSTLATRLKEDFGSIEILRDEMLAMAHAMFGPGFVWLVRTEQKGDTLQQFGSRKFRLLCTYLAGSPLAGAHNRAQPLDMNTQNVEAAKAAGGLQGLSNEEYTRQTTVQNNIGTAGAHAAGAKNNKTSFGGVHITPVLCVNTWQHAWLPDHGVEGKYSFLQKWWDMIDWKVVDDLSGTSMPEQNSFGHSLGGSSGGGSFHYT
ncbi:hypothetical protein BLS_007018 [Venturia inaequalis]|uniref:Manganese/iron superoxide dismutase C-terminal domain-containing protein n=1 Tax=Venturia inaequalis TaxID=5025 RepID=A0A8H3U9N3_VENIN|nr:hypothetical protein BLS_007018 [Venturia inaequalis]